MGARTREASSTRYQLPEPLPTLLVNDSDQYLYKKESILDTELKRLLVRVVKAVKLHGTDFDLVRYFSFLSFFLLQKKDVEQPYCILELNHPKQVKQTEIAKNGLNPYVSHVITMEKSCCFFYYGFCSCLFRFWDERFVFECDGKSNQIHLQIIDRKKSNKRNINNYGLYI